MSATTHASFEMQPTETPTVPSRYSAALGRCRSHFRRPAFTSTCLPQLSVFVCRLVTTLERRRMPRPLLQMYNTRLVSHDPFCFYRPSVLSIQFLLNWFFFPVDILQRSSYWAYICGRRHLETQFIRNCEVHPRHSGLYRSSVSLSGCGLSRSAFVLCTV
jgi:hypothetical protein